MCVNHMCHENIVTILNLCHSMLMAPMIIGIIGSDTYIVDQFLLPRCGLMTNISQSIATMLPLGGGGVTQQLFGVGIQQGCPECDS